MENNFSMVDWAKDKKPVWDKVCDKYGGKKEAFDWGTWDFFDWAIGKTWPTIGTNNKARKYGWTRVDGESIALNNFSELTTFHRHRRDMD